MKVGWIRFWNNIDDVNVHIKKRTIPQSLLFKGLAHNCLLTQQPALIMAESMLYSLSYITL